LPYRHQLRAGTLKPLRWPPEILTRDDGPLNTVRSRAVFKPHRNGNRHSPTLAALTLLGTRAAIPRLKPPRGTHRICSCGGRVIAGGPAWGSAIPNLAPLRCTAMLACSPSGVSTQECSKGVRRYCRRPSPNSTTGSKACWRALQQWSAIRAGAGPRRVRTGARQPHSIDCRRS
jgi:hypothetical protein